MKNKIIILAFLIAFGITPSFSSSFRDTSTDAATASGVSLRTVTQLKTVTDSDSEEEMDGESPCYDSGQLTTRAFGRLKCGCEAFEMIESDESLSGIMHLTLKQISEDPELKKNEHYVWYDKNILKDIPEIALELENHIKMQFPDEKEFEKLIREKVSLNWIYDAWKKIINEIEGGAPLARSGAGGAAAGGAGD